MPCSIFALVIGMHKLLCANKIQIVRKSRNFRFRERAKTGPIFYLWLSKVLAKERCYTCNFIVSYKWSWFPIRQYKHYFVHISTTLCIHSSCPCFANRYADIFTRTSVRVSKMNAAARAQLTFQMLTLLKKYLYRQGQCSKHETANVWPW